MLKLGDLLGRAYGVRKAYIVEMRPFANGAIYNFYVLTCFWAGKVL
jgi:hypothetical protein